MIKLALHQTLLSVNSYCGKGQGTRLILKHSWNNYNMGQLQHGATANVSTITNTDVFNNTRPAYGFYNLMPDQPMGFITLCQTSLWVVQLHVGYV